REAGPWAARLPADAYLSAASPRQQAESPECPKCASLSGGRPAASTMCRVLAAGKLPVRFEVIDAIIGACGGEEEDRERFWSAWRRLIMPGQEARTVTGGVRAFPGPR